ncbi:MAG: bifunctional UDP-N-acetylglucosamine diphosphorylase/glucosamine-1-phosphate N-acetyltransferase GlmU [Pseudolabrys sp.]|nr:bifunctional UDP-N-acetylglucosamine diphosphorylase/glucosamine-1-phosphate N-acetyltransferase GlmU [Pseudolabrys sp.]
MSRRTCLAIVLAAGDGTRMLSNLPKVLHVIAGRSLLAHVLTAVGRLRKTRIVVVTAPKQDSVSKETHRIVPSAQLFVQRERRGTAHAVLIARAALKRRVDDVLVVFGDTPLIRVELLDQLRDAIANGAAVAVLGFRPLDPTGYGRLVTQGGELLAVREEKEATETERRIALCNGGLMAFSGKTALSIIDQIGNANQKREYYLTEAVAVARRMGLKTAVIEADEDDVRGINTKAQLAQAEAVMQRRLRASALNAGVTLVAPETVFLSADTKFGRDVVVEPNVVIGPAVSIADSALIRSFSHLEGARVGKGARVGPYARLRPGADLEQDVHIGNFVEVKAAKIQKGAKANHLTYIGDARVGVGANVGAGTITCNYDGLAKHRTDIGHRAFIGSNTALVAPVKVGDGAYIGSGSVITRNVPPGSLSLERSPQIIKKGWAKSLRRVKPAGKQTKSARKKRR